MYPEPYSIYLGGLHAYPILHISAFRLAVEHYTSHRSRFFGLSFLIATDASHGIQSKVRKVITHVCLKR